MYNGILTSVPATTLVDTMVRTTLVALGSSTHLFNFAVHRGSVVASCNPLFTKWEIVGCGFTAYELK